jgi:AraC family transcriptional regulator
LLREASNRRAREYVMRVREVIARRFHEPLTLMAVSKAVGCSPYHLSRIVSAHEGAPIHRLIIRHRLRHALECVLGTKDSLSSIAIDAGFASQSHFGDSFRREFGCAPGMVRRLGRCA